MNFKGTPGPWYIHDNRSYDKIYERYAGTFDIRTNPEGTADSKSLWIADVKPYDGQGFTGKEAAEANAKLIAASPEMLNMLVACKEFIKTHMHYPGEGMIDKIQQVIDKATT